MRLYQGTLLPFQILNFFPTVDDQKFQRHNYTVLVSRVLVEHLCCFSALKDVCIFHIPHKYSNKMAKESEVVSYSFFSFGFFYVGFCFCKGFQSLISSCILNY